MPGRIFYYLVWVYILGLMKMSYSLNKDIPQIGYYLLTGRLIAYIHENLNWLVKI